MVAKRFLGQERREARCGASGERRDAPEGPFCLDLWPGSFAPWRRCAPLPMLSIATRRALSTYFHRRVRHLTALQVVRLGAWSAVMLAHHKGRATMSEKPARPPAGSLFAATGGRHRRLTMSRHRRRAASYPEAAKRRSYVLPSYESKYSARAAWRC